jgi:hypothetical protein
MNAVPAGVFAYAGVRMLLATPYIVNALQTSRVGGGPPTLHRDP